MDSSTPSLAVTTERQGASYVAEYLVRKVNIYPITEVELNTMALFNTISAAAFSGAAFAAGSPLVFGGMFRRTLTSLRKH